MQLSEALSKLRITLTNTEIENRTLKNVINQYEAQISKMKKEMEEMTKE